MKSLLFVFLILFIPASGICVSVEEIGRLGELKTDEDLIFEIIHKEGIDRAIDAKDVIYLKERGLSERVIQYLWKQSFQDKKFLPPQDGESKMVGENLRSYYSVDESGNKFLVLTNLDEEGRRMGPPPPPAQERPSYLDAPSLPAPRQSEMVLPVRQQGPAWASQEEDSRTYNPPAVGMPIFTSSYYPFYSVLFLPAAPNWFPHCKPSWVQHHKGNNHGSGFWSGSKSNQRIR